MYSFILQLFTKNNETDTLSTCDKFIVVIHAS